MRIEIGKSANDDDLGDYGEFTLSIPDPLGCNDRGRLIREERRSHPSHASCAVEIDLRRSETVHPITSFSVDSQQSPCMAFVNRKHFRFAGLSMKTRRMVSGTGPNEFAAWKELETNPRWVDFDMQTARVAWQAEGEQASYLADVIAVDDAGQIYAWELKADRSYYDAPEYEAVMRHAKVGFESACVALERHTGFQLRGSDRYRLNVDRAFGDRFTQIDPVTKCRVEEMLRGGATLTLGDIEEVLDADPLVARAKTHALVCQRVISVSLSGVIDRETAVSSTVNPVTVPDIRLLRHENDN
ncbi:hypothetical protein J7348_13810 [Qipengyuania flava]|uniref:hypothetical protein n=1 Tax=Qipengyuania flava TaxID=192812 RepID=UPI001AD9A0EC|nr:hypothetical protein [Qipengyuania flava]MBO9505699.1 hypothetical protein [Qipengyuania flava]